MAEKLMSLSDSEVEKRLALELPAWRLEDGAIRRDFSTDGWPTSLLLVNAIGFMSEAAWHHPDLVVSWGRVSVALKTHDAGGITDRDLALAREIDRVALWRPGRESPLPGVPRRWVGPADV